MKKEIRFMVQSAIYIIAMVLFSTNLSYCNQPSNSELPLVVVNGDTITTKNIDKLLIKTHKTMDMANKTDFDYNKLLTKLVNDLLILQDAYAIGLDDNEALQKILNDKRKEIIRKLYLSQTFKPEFNITDKQVKDFFHENLRRYQFRTISLASQEEALTIYDLLKQGYKFDSLATEKSLDHRRFKNGLQTVTFKMNVDKVLLEEADKMEIGEFSQPIKYQEFYSIIKLEKKMDADTTKFEIFKDKIIDKFKEEQKEVSWNNFIAELSLKYPVAVDSNLINEIKNAQADVLRKEFRDGTEKPVLSINDNYFINDNQLRTEVSHATMNSGTTPFDIILVNSIIKMQEKLLSTYAAVQNGYYDSTRVVDWYYQTLDSSLIELYIKEMIVSKIRFNSEEFEKYYNNHLEDFRKPDQFILEQMIIPDHDDSHDAAIALKDGAQWSYIFKKYNCIDKNESDKNKWISLENYIPKVKDELKTLRVGQTSTSFQAAEGFVIFKIKDRKIGGIMPISDVDMQIREVMFQQKFNQLLDMHLEKIKNNSEIKYFDEEVNLYFGKE